MAACGGRERWPLKWQPHCCPLGTCCSPCFPFVPVQELLTVFGLSDCIWIIYFYPPSSPPRSAVLSLYQRGAWLLLCAAPPCTQLCLAAEGCNFTACSPLQLPMTSPSDYIKHREEAFIYACFLLIASAVSVYNTHANPTAGTGLSFA